MSVAVGLCRHAIRGLWQQSVWCAALEKERSVGVHGHDQVM